ncbi:MAG: CDP-glucose 4,6-dehydratase [Cellulomonadaceae bacterium]|nr:CDP-glucose 4,6-dehydratase [Cellulomonadaceae bacterium]
MHVLVTGHTGFKGAWLALMLTARGDTVSGLALEPAEGSVHDRARVAEVLAHDLRVDVRDPDALTRAFDEVQPDVVMHLAAQPLVRESYRDPRTTYTTNTMGTFNVLEATRATPSVAAQVVVTTDKVYRNVDQIWGYRESDPLGGADPYSASKAAADLLTQSWIVSSGATAATAIARAGNVVGGGDVCPERLMVDLVAAFSSGRPVQLRYPVAVRPWQHVLDCLNGYVVLADALVAGSHAGEAFNFGPDTTSFVPVGTVAREVAALWGPGCEVELADGPHAHEANLLALDARKAELALGWRNRLGFHQTLEWTVEWEKAVRAGADARTVTLDQIERFAAMTPVAP